MATDEENVYISDEYINKEAGPNRSTRALLALPASLAKEGSAEQHPPVQ